MGKWTLTWALLLATLLTQGQNLSFYKDIQPLIHTRCATCHRPGGGAPFNLITYDDVSRKLSFIKKVVTSGYMPPWRANDHYAAFSNSRKLSEEELNKLIQWIDSGAPKGKVSLAAERQLQKMIELGTTYHRTPDLTLKMKYAYKLKGDGVERFVVFKIPFELDSEANVEAIEFMSNNKRLIHHANFAIHPVEDPSIDIYGTIDSINLNTSRYLYDQWLPYKKEMTYYGGWIPGTSYESYPRDMGWVMPRRGVMLLTIHFSPTGKDEESLNGVNFFFTKNPIQRTVKVISLGSAGIGERDIFPPLLLLPNDVRTFRLRVANSKEDLSVLYVWPHMHYLGKEFKAFATHNNTDTIPLVHIPEWDFRWQEIYRYKKPVILKQGDIVHMYGTYDNTANNPMNPNNPPIVVESTGDMRSDQEMFTMLLLYVSYKPGDENLILD
jgi:hypothetical protein